MTPEELQRFKDRCHRYIPGDANVTTVDETEMLVQEIERLHVAFDGIVALHDANLRELEQANERERQLREALTVITKIKEALRKKLGDIWRKYNQLHNRTHLLESNNTRLRAECMAQDHTICQIAGKVLDYPWYKDDQKNFVSATEADGVCVGEHVAESIVAELANRYCRLRDALTNLVAKIKLLTPTIDAKFMFAELHGQSYKGGPTWVKEMAEAEAAIAVPPRKRKE